MLSTLLAIAWKPEFHGVVIIIVATVALPGTIYLILGTNLGARLGLLVSLAGLFGWMATMGFIWWAYGIGLTGKTPVWKPSEVIVVDADLSALGIGPSDGLAADPRTRSEQNLNALAEEGWEKLPDDSPSRALAIATTARRLERRAQPPHRRSRGRVPRKRCGLLSDGIRVRVACGAGSAAG